MEFFWGENFDYYIGFWKDGQFEGYGKYIQALDREVQEGYFEDSEFTQSKESADANDPCSYISRRRLTDAHFVGGDFESYIVRGEELINELSKLGVKAQKKSTTTQYEGPPDTKRQIET